MIQPDVTAERSMPPPAGSISFVVAAANACHHVEQQLKVLGAARHADDEVILLIRQENAGALADPPPWLRVVPVPDASVFDLRRRVPAVCRKEWVVVLEDHSIIETCAIAAIRRLIKEQPDSDIIPFLVKNLTSVDVWDWAIFIYNFATVWAPLDHPPPFSCVTFAIVRRARFETEVALNEGEWDLRLIQKIFATGKKAYSNDIFVDHVAPFDFIGALVVIFHNARAAAGFHRALGTPAYKLIREGMYALLLHPSRLLGAVANRQHELPPGTRWRLHALGIMHLIGNVTGLLFGGGRSAHQLI